MASILVVRPQASVLGATVQNIGGLATGPLDTKWAVRAYGPAQRSFVGSPPVGALCALVCVFFNNVKNWKRCVGGGALIYVPVQTRPPKQRRSAVAGSCMLVRRVL